MSFHVTRWPKLIAEQPEAARAEVSAALTASGDRPHIAAKALGLSRDQLRRTCAKLGIVVTAKRGRAAHATPE